MRNHHTLAAALLAIVPLVAVAHGGSAHGTAAAYDAAKVEPTDFGQQGNPKKARRTVQVRMSDAMRFSPATLTVRRGDTVRFVVHNDGRVLHEMVLGTPKAIDEHAALMKRFPEMEHADANMAHVKPGARGEMVWQFTQPGTFRYACLQPGHYEAGMVGEVTVK
jgi:uncharacterized cupredoxin-like copper-binding protein